jgi:hypothetical protein
MLTSVDKPEEMVPLCRWENNALKDKPGFNRTKQRDFAKIIMNARVLLAACSQADFLLLFFFWS